MFGPLCAQPYPGSSCRNDRAGNPLKDRLWIGLRTQKAIGHLVIPWACYGLQQDYSLELLNFWGLDSQANAFRGSPLANTRTF